MTKGVALSPEQKERIYNMYLSGMRQAEIGKLFGVHSVTVSKVVSGQRKLHEEGKMAEVVVAGDKRNGRLYSLGQEKFKGECLVGGKMKHRTFSAPNAQRAKVEWEKWRNTLLDEQSFIDMVERKEPVDEPEVVCGAPSDPIEEIRPIETVVPDDEEIYEAQEEIDKDFEEQLEKKSVVLDTTIADTELAEPKLGHWFNKNGSFAVVWKSKPVYLIWAKGDEPRCYGVYGTMDKALKEVDKMNEVASFLGSDDAFEIEEVAWKS